MAPSCRVAVDLLGAEYPSSDLLRGALEATDEFRSSELLFICDQESLSSELIRKNTVIHCAECVREEDSLRDVLAERVQCSMHVGMHLLAAHEVDAFVSVGSTGALMALGRHILRTPQGINRPAVIKEFEGSIRSFWMLDLGANIVKRPETLVEFAKLGTAYASQVGCVAEPRVALLNIGIEERKGPLLLRSAARLLEQSLDIEFCGFVEPNRMFYGEADVIVTDGYAGNISLKSMEGTANFIRDVFLAEFSQQDKKMGRHLVRKNARRRFTQLMQKLDSQHHNGASFVGLNGVVVKSHNSTTESGMTAAVKQAIREVEAEAPKKIQQFFAT